jgi:hypothetical protein
VELGSGEAVTIDVGVGDAAGLELGVGVGVVPSTGLGLVVPVLGDGLASTVPGEVEGAGVGSVLAPV